MAMLDEKRGLIRDRSKGHRDMVYYIPKKSSRYMKACKEAHETVCRFLPESKRESITNKEMKSMVLRFAVNKLLAQTPLQMVSYQMGHSKTDITANLYGKFVPEHFKAGHEETIKIRKAHLDWLENDYFDSV